jgi:hypothetical protein
MLTVNHVSHVHDHRLIHTRAQAMAPVRLNLIPPVSLPTIYPI